MAVQNFILDLMESLLEDKELGLKEEDLRFYDKNTTVQEDDALNDHIIWKNARYYNEDTNVVRSSLLIVQLHQGDRTHYASFQVGELYRIYRKDGMKALLPIMRANLKDAREGLEGAELLAEGFDGSYEAIKGQLILRPLNLDDSSKALEQGIFRQVGDMALTLYLDVNRTASGTILTSMVKRDMFGNWGVTEEEALEWALRNTMTRQPPVLCPLMPSQGLSVRKVRFLEDESVSFHFDQPMAPILTTEQGVNGAIAAFYPGVLQRLYRMIGDDYYLSFTGISEVHIHPLHGKFGLHAMRKSLADMNRINRRGELLSRNLYLYKGETGEFCGVK